MERATAAECEAAKFACLNHLAYFLYRVKTVVYQTSSESLALLDSKRTVTGGSLTSSQGCVRCVVSHQHILNNRACPSNILLRIINKRTNHRFTSHFYIMRSSLSTDEDPLHYSVASQESSDDESLHLKERPTTTRSRGTLHLSTPTLQRSPIKPSRNLTLIDEQEAHATRKWAFLDPRRLFHERRRLLWQAHDDDGDNPENTNARIAPKRQSKTLQPSLRSSAKAAVVEPLRLSAKVAVDTIAFPFRHNKSSREQHASTTTGGPITIRTILNPFRWRQQQREEDDVPMEPFATRNNQSIRNLVGTALPTISRQSWWDFLAMLLSYFTGWFANGIVIIGCLVVSSTAADWWSHVLRVVSWPRQIAANWIWLLQWVRNEIRNVMEGTGHQKYVYMAGAGVAIHKASNIKMPRLTRRPKRHSTKNEDW